jgi:cytochrome c biogenesis protein CcmG/thiol:disulfide interchange protein DsbE
MKKSVLIVIAILAVIVVAAHYADKATRLPHTTASASLAKADSPSDGKAAPDISLKDLDGKDVRIAQYKGQIVLVNFWATWCEPCKVEIPWLIAMQQKYGAKGFTVLGVAMDDEGRSAVAPFVQKETFDVQGGGQSHMNYPIVIGNDAAADKFGGLLGYPTSVLINRDGKVVKRITGLISPDEISKTIESQL